VIKRELNRRLIHECRCDGRLRVQTEGSTRLVYTGFYYCCFFLIDKGFETVYYESIKRELKTRPIYECRCDERLKTKAEESTLLTYTGLRGELEHLKIETRLIDEMFVSVSLSGPSGLASNPANREIASSSGASVHQDILFFRFFSILFSKKLEKNSEKNLKKYDLTRPKVSKYSLTS
jgi:hypothetical protein